MTKKLFFGAAIAASALLVGCGRDDADKPTTPEVDPVEETGEVAIPDAPESPLAEVNKKKSDAFLAAEREKDGMRELDSGLLIETLEEGNGETPTPEDLIRFHFAGSLIDGTKLQDTRTNGGEPVVVPSPAVPQLDNWTQIDIPGVSEALATMSEGESVRIVVPPELAYGAEGVPGRFEPFTTLVFTVDLVEVVGPDETDRRAEIEADQQDLLAVGQATQQAQRVAEHQQVKWVPMAGEEAVSEASTALSSAAETFENAITALGETDESDKPALRAALEEVETAFNAYAEAAATYDEAVIAANEEASAEYLAEMKAQDGVQETESGLLYEVVEDGGDGATPDPTDTVTVHYRGTLPDGTEFDSSYSRGEPTSFPLNAVIPGWTEGVGLMNVGDKYKFYIPADLAYGQNVRPGGPIGPDLALAFEVELLDIESPGDQGGQ